MNQYPETSPTKAFIGEWTREQEKVSCRLRFFTWHCSRCGVSGAVRYKVSVRGAASSSLKVTLMDKDGRSVASSNKPSGVLTVVDVRLWWPYLMHESPGYLYSLEVRQHLWTSIGHVFIRWIIFLIIGGTNGGERPQQHIYHWGASGGDKSL